MRDIDCPDCGRPYAINSWPFPCGGRGHDLGPFYGGDSQIHTSEKVVVYENRFTGEVRIPGRGDRPLHPKLAAEGYERKTLDTIADIRRVEKQKGLIHESSNYSKNSVTAEKDCGAK